MSSKPFDIDDRLLADSHALHTWRHCQIRLNKNATIPWLLIIPETDLIEFCDLPAEHQLNITLLAQMMGQYMKDHLGVEKINFAAIGNVVQQLHIHVVGRHSADPLWPDVVWGNPLPEAGYSKAEIAQWQATLKTLAGDVA